MKCWSGPCDNNKRCELAQEKLELAEKWQLKLQVLSAIPFPDVHLMQGRERSWSDVKSSRSHAQEAGREMRRTVEFVGSEVRLNGRVVSTDYLAEDNLASYVPLTIITPRCRRHLEHAEFEVIDPGSPKGFCSAKSCHRPTTSPRSSIQMTLAFRASNPDSLGTYPWRSLSFERKVRDGPIADLDPTPPMPPANLVRCPRLSPVTRSLAVPSLTRVAAVSLLAHLLH